MENKFYNVYGDYMKSIKKLLLVMVFVVFFCAAGYYLIYSSNKESQRIKDFVTTEGVIVDYREDFEPVNDDYSYDYDSYFNPDYKYAPIVEYYVNDRKYLVYSDKYSRKPAYIGTPVEVKYNPNDPSDAVINGTINNSINKIVGGILIVAGLSAMILCFIPFKKK